MFRNGERTRRACHRASAEGISHAGGSAECPKIRRKKGKLGKHKGKPARE